MRRRGPRARAPSRNRPVIVAVMSSLPSGGVEVSTPTTSPMSDSVRRALAMSSRMSPSAWPRSKSRRSGWVRLCSKPSGVGSQHARRARSTNGSPDVDQRAHRPGDALLGRHRVDPGRRQPRVDVARRRPAPARPAGPRGSGSSGRPWPGRPRRPRRRRSCSPAPPAGREDLRGSVEDRCGDALLQAVREAGSDIAVSVTV